MNSVVEASGRGRIHSRAWPQDGVLARVGGPVTVALAVAVSALAFAVDPAGARPFTSLRWAIVSTAVCAAAVVASSWSLPMRHRAGWAVLVVAMVVGAVAGPDPTGSTAAGRSAWL